MIFLLILFYQNKTNIIFFQFQVMELLLRHGADINAVNKGRCTALHIAAHKQPVHCVSLLLSRGADVNIQDSYGDTALHDAIGKESCPVIELLSEAPGKLMLNIIAHTILLTLMKYFRCRLHDS